MDPNGPVRRGVVRASRATTVGMFGRSTLESRIHLPANERLAAHRYLGPMSKTSSPAVAIALRKRRLFGHR